MFSIVSFFPQDFHCHVHRPSGILVPKTLGREQSIIIIFFQIYLKLFLAGQGQDRRVDKAPSKTYHLKTLWQYAPVLRHRAWSNYLWVWDGVGGRRYTEEAIEKKYLMFTIKQIVTFPPQCVFLNDTWVLIGRGKLDKFQKPTFSPCISPADTGCHCFLPAQSLQQHILLFWEGPICLPAD